MQTDEAVRLGPPPADDVTRRATARAQGICRGAVCLGIAAAVAWPAPASATSCSSLDVEAIVRDVVEICWAGVADRRAFDAARERSHSGYWAIDGPTRFAGRIGMLEYDEGRTCTLWVAAPRWAPSADEAMDALSRELGLGRVEIRFDPTTRARTYSWPGGDGVEARRLEADLKVATSPPRRMSCESDQLTITVRNLSTN